MLRVKEMINLKIWDVGKDIKMPYNWVDEYGKLQDAMDAIEENYEQRKHGKDNYNFWSYQVLKGNELIYERVVVC